MNERNQHNWPTFKPADLDQLIKYKRGELSDKEAHQVEVFLSEFDADILDDLSVAELESLRGIEFKAREVQTKAGWSAMRIAASIAVVVGILALTYVLTQDKLVGNEIVMHESQDDLNDAVQDETTEVIEADETVSEDLAEDAINIEESASEQEEVETSTKIADNEADAQGSDLALADEAAVEHKKDKSSNNNENVKLDADDIAMEETEATSVSRYKIADKDAATKAQDPVVYTIIEKYNNPKDKPADVPKSARAFAKSTVGVSKNTFRRKVSPSYPGGDKALIKWFEDNYSPLIEAGEKPFKLTFKVTKKAKLVDVTFVEIDKTDASKFSKKLKEMPDWNKPESEYDPLDIYYSIWIAPR